MSAVYTSSGYDTGWTAIYNDALAVTGISLFGSDYLGNIANGGSYVALGAGNKYVSFKLTSAPMKVARTDGAIEYRASATQTGTLASFSPSYGVPGTGLLGNSEMGKAIKQAADAIKQSVTNAVTKVPDTGVPFVVNKDGLTLRTLKIQWWLVAVIGVGGLVVFNGLTHKER